MRFKRKRRRSPGATRVCCSLGLLIIIIGAVLLPVLISSHNDPLLDVSQEQVLLLGENGMLEAGDRINITTWIVNPGRVDLTNVTITGVSCEPILLLRAGDFEICYTEYIITQSDIGFGNYTLSTCVKSGEIMACTSSETDLTQTTTGSLSVEQSIQFNLGDNDLLSVGDTANVTIRVCNNGTETILNVSSSMYTGPALDLTPNECFDFFWNYELSRTTFDETFKTFEEVATGTGLTSATIIRAVSVVETSLLRPIVRRIDALQEQTLVLGSNQMLNAGDPISIRTIVRNTGTLDLFGLRVLDSANVGTLCGPDNIDNRISVLLEGDSVTCHAMRTVSQMDIDRAIFQLDTIIVGDNVTANVSSDNNLTQSTFGALEIVQDYQLILGENGVLTKDDLINVTVKLINTGTETLLNVTADNLNGSISELRPAHCFEFAWTYVILQEDLDVMVKVFNQTASGVGITSALDIEAFSTLTSNLTRPDFVFIDVAYQNFMYPRRCANVGSIVTFEVDVVNLGSIVAVDLAVTDSLIGANLVCGPFGSSNIIDTLFPGETQICMGAYMLQASDDVYGQNTTLIFNAVAGNATATGQIALRGKTKTEADWTGATVSGVTTNVDIEGFTTFDSRFVGTFQQISSGPQASLSCYFFINALVVSFDQLVRFDNFARHPRSLYLQFGICDLMGGVQYEVVTIPSQLRQNFNVSFNSPTANLVYNPNTGYIVSTAPSGVNSACILFQVDTGVSLGSISFIRRTAIGNDFIAYRVIEEISI